jgi:ribonuclease R
MAKRGSRAAGRRGRGKLLSAVDEPARILETPSPVGKRKTSHSFASASDDRAAMSEVTIVERFGSDEDGVPLARPLTWPGSDPAPVLRLLENELGEPLPIGGRAAARLIQRESGEIEARIIRSLGPGSARIVGVFHRGLDGGTIMSADRRDRAEYQVAKRDAEGAEDGELVTAENLSTGRSASPRARIIKRLGHSSDAGVISLLAIATYDIPTEFPTAAIAEAETALPASLSGRTDLRDIALVTIDGSDARDFDDAVWAEPDPDPGNRDGWHLIVAIADVAHYVRPGSALDREAARRGNSVYFPDRVVPMLPEALSNDLCSLKPGVDRACVAVHLWIDAFGHKRRHRFERGLMRSTARLTYEEIQGLRDNGSERASPLTQEALAALYGAFAALAAARARRGALELDIGENRVVLDAEGRPAAIIPVARLDSHRLIEEFMILANVAAAEELEARRQPCMYRVHDAPDPEKVEELRALLVEIGIAGLSFAKGQAPKPELFNRVLRRAEATPAAALVNELVLRCQAQAVYSLNNIGHFGLGLRRYAHFTSPIRRYADLVVHRALIAGTTGRGLGPVTDPLTSDADREALTAVAKHISATERRAAAAERAAIERYRATLLARSIGSIFTGRISGVAEFGLFVTASASGAEGLVPVSTLPSDYYEYDARAQRLIGRRTGQVFRIGDEVVVRLVEADGIGGRIVFRIEQDEAIATSRHPAQTRIGARARQSARRRPRRQR